MVRLRALLLAVFTSLLVSLSLGVSLAASVQPSGELAEVIPPYVVCYSSVPSIEFDLSSRSDVLALAGTPVLPMLDDGSESEFKSTYLPVLLSLLIPGAGETYLGYWKRGIALIGVEVIAWSGYIYYNNQGLDTRAASERFMDAHWDNAKWIRDHEASKQLNPTNPELVTLEELDEFGASGMWAGWPPYHTYVGPENPIDYYETRVKYEWFISGWEDYNSASDMETPLRSEFRKLRNQSDEEITKAERFLYLSLGARVFSLLETIILVKRENAERDLDRAGGSFHLTASSTGLRSGEIAFIYRFK